LNRKLYKLEEETQNHVEVPFSRDVDRVVSGNIQYQLKNTMSFELKKKRVYSELFSLGNLQTEHKALRAIQLWAMQF